MLLDNQPIAGSTNATAQTLNISELLGEEENTLHLNTWNDGSGIHDWSFVLRRDGEVVWEASSEVENEPRGAAYYNRIVIGAEGNVVDPLDVPLFLQDSEPWGNYFYDGHTAEEATPGNRNDMDELGCYTTSGAMIINYLAAEVGVAHRTDPGLLNAAAQGSGGYSGTSFVPDFVNTYGEQHNIPIYFHGYLWGRNPANDQRIADYLAAGQPVILKIPAQPNTPSGHFVAATGVTETAGGDLTFAINDPEYGATTLAEYHNNNYHSARLFGDTQKNESALFVSGHSPIELVITDPLGRKSGYDPRTGTTLAEIPGATYGTVTFGPVDAATAEAEVEAREFHLGDPVEGTYVIEVIGTGDGAYTVHASAFRTGKSMDNREYAGSTTLNEVDRIVLQYDEVSGLNGPRLYLPYVTR